MAFQTDNGEIVPVEVLAEEVGAHSNKVIKDIVKVAKEKGINEGNSLYYYSNATFYEENPGKLYNDLKFIELLKTQEKNIASDSEILVRISTRTADIPIATSIPTATNL